MAFTPGVLAFTRVITSDALGEQIGSSPAATHLGQILDADVYFDPSDAQVTFATPAALPAAPKAYDLESVLRMSSAIFWDSATRRFGTP